MNLIGLVPASAISTFGGFSGDDSELLLSFAGDFTLRSDKPAETGKNSEGLSGS
jgi:hypothetical protein